MRREVSPVPAEDAGPACARCEDTGTVLYSSDYCGCSAGQNAAIAASVCHRDYCGPEPHDLAREGAAVMGASRREPYAGERDDRQLCEARTVEIPAWSPPAPRAPSRWALLWHWALRRLRRRALERRDEWADEPTLVETF